MDLVVVLSCAALGLGLHYFISDKWGERKRVLFLVAILLVMLYLGFQGR